MSAQTSVANSPRLVHRARAVHRATRGSAASGLATRGATLAFCVGLLVGCSDSVTAGEPTGRAALALNSTVERVLGFESAADWSHVDQLSSTHTEGTSSGLVAVNGWTEVTSTALSTIGEVSSALSVDVRVPAELAWGQLRIIVKIPSQQEWWVELGSRSLAGLAPGAFHTLEFSLPEPLRQKLANDYDDLTLTVVINGPSGDYLLDRLHVSEADPVPPPTPGGQALVFHVPRGMDWQSSAIHAESGLLALGDGVTVVRADGGFGVVTNSGVAQTNLGVSAHTADVVSVPNVVLRNNAVVHGAVVTGGIVDPQAGAEVLGTTQESASIQLEELRLGYELPTDTLPGMTIGPDGEHTPEADTLYGAMNVHSRSVLYLAGGDYHFQGLDIEPQATLDIDNSAGAVRVFVHGGFIFRGKIVYRDPLSANTLFAVTGSEGVDVDAPFVGTILAPNAPLDLISTDRGHTGAFWAASVTANPHTIITHGPQGRNDCEVVDDGCGRVPGCPATRVCPTDDELAAVRPTVDCVIVRFDGSLIGAFGYENDLAHVVRVPLGEDNSFGVSLASQPTIFQPGAHPREFYVTFTGTASWTLGNETVTVSASTPRCEDTDERLDKPIRVTGRRDNESGASTPGEGSSEVPIDFEIPDKLRVTLGGAGNGAATLSFVDGLGATVTCTYRGGSRVTEPIHDLDRALGRFYFFESCDSGAVAGDSAQGTTFEVNVVSGDPTYDLTETTAELGPGCGVLDAPIAPYESVEMRQAFSWQLTEALPVDDPDGLPAMRYALIYVEDEEQLERLQRLGVYVRHMPIFTSDLQRYEGKCGTVDSKGDGNGTFVYAFMLAELYNLFRQQALTALDAGQGKVPLRTVILPEIPSAELRNDDGTLNWAKAYEAGLDVLPPPEGTPASLLGVKVPVVDDAIQVVEDEAQEAWDAIGGPEVVDGVSQVVFGDEVLPTDIELDPSFSEAINDAIDIAIAARRRVHEILGEIDKFLNGSVDATFNYEILNRDGFFGRDNPLRRSWGTVSANRGLGSLIVPDGISLEVWKTTSVTPFEPDLLPVSFFGTLGQDGAVRMEVSRGGRSLGLCFALENDAAVLAEELVPDQWCDFTTGISFNQNVTRHWRLNDFKLHTHTLLTDSYHFARATIPGFSPRQAEVNAGLLGSVVTSPGSANTVCLNFPEVADVVSEVGVAASGLVALGIAPAAAGLVAWNYATKDMFLAKGGNVEFARGVVPHEYGHFLMCNLAYEESPSALLGLIRDRVSASGPRPEVETVFEAFADFFASQATSGTNYADFSDGTHVDAVANDGMDYCVGRNCLESGCTSGGLCRGRFNGTLIVGLSAANYRGGAAETPVVGTGVDVPFFSEVRRLVTLFHDTVDRPNDAWRGVAGLPTNADAWQQTTAGGASLTFRPNGFQRDADDDVSVGLEILREWIDEMYAGCAFPNPAGCNANVDRTLGELDDALTTLGVNWCDRCEVFALHDPSTAARTANTQPEQWAACLAGQLAAIVGSPPAPIERLRASDCQVCPDGTVGDGNGNCDACAPGFIQIGNGCFFCGLGFISDPATNTCIECPPDQISDLATNTCVACPDGYGADPAANTCVECLPDRIVTLVQESTCGSPGGNIRLHAETSTFVVPPTGDNCPEATWVEIRGFEQLENGTLTPWQDDFIFEAQHTSPPTLAECSGSTLIYDTFIPGMPGVWNHIGHIQNFGGLNVGGLCVFDSEMRIARTFFLDNDVDTVRLRGEAFNNGDPRGIFFQAHITRQCPSLE